MSTITFLSTEIDTKIIKCSLNEKMKDVCNRYAKEVNKSIKRLIFFSDGQKLIKKLSVNEFYKSNPEKELFVVLMDEDVDSESEEEKEKAKSKKLKDEIIDTIKNTKKEITFEKTQELIVQYGYDSQKRIEKEKKEHPENFIEIEEAIKKKGKDEKLYVLGQLGKSLKNMGIEVAIEKTESKNNDDSLIVNQFISSGMLQEIKYEIHFEDDIDINKKYAIINNEEGEQEKFIEKMKGFLSENIKIPKNDIFIANIREGCIAFDTIIKNSKNINVRGKMIELAKKNKIKSIYEKNILGACKLTPNMLDKRGNRDPSEWPKTIESRGGMPYHAPTSNWVGYGLKVVDQYDDGNDWIAMDGNPREWAVAFHGTSVKAVKPICEANGKFFSTVEEGATRQAYKDDLNTNIKSKDSFPICGIGAYASPYLEEANEYSTGAVIMCRVNPYKVRIPEEKIWITDGTRNSIRPYRILIDLKKIKI